MTARASTMAAPQTTATTPLVWVSKLLPAICGGRPPRQGDRHAWMRRAKRPGRSHSTARRAAEPSGAAAPAGAGTGFSLY
ncbi:unnamed protein product (plasmid) [Mycetohabitans rhizoxinica HKI 454]|uniref:Uncharacterized protein n=1 Tax=Mycetohabitans rhizoxinica (strain DSM 19002 / CIP 109453 / HKI 454) TaxID=882378 RepID=E5AUY4_MYCRK|nr:unnamed protein product [Mycetohabitans rhizoxinica HKI 454]